MSDYGVKVNQCAHCEYREVCSLKAEFLEAQKAVIARVRDIKHIEPVELRCEHYIPNTGVNII